VIIVRKVLAQVVIPVVDATVEVVDGQQVDGSEPAGIGTPRLLPA
jgi:hypothetical protein